MKILKSPYSQENSKSLDDICLKYCNDPKAIIEIDNLKFYKIVQLLQVKTKNTLTIISIDQRLNLKINDILVDENGHYYTIKGFEMINFGIYGCSKWYDNFIFVSIVGDIENIGEYIALSDKC